MGGSLAGAGAGMGSLGARSLEWNGQSAGCADAEASRPALGRPWRDTLAAGPARAGSGVGAIGSVATGTQDLASGLATGQFQASRQGGRIEAGVSTSAQTSAQR